MSYSERLREIRNEAIESIIKKTTSLKSGIKVLKKPIEVMYESTDNGFFSDDVAAVSGSEVYCVEEGMEPGEDYSLRYDFDEDEDCIVSANFSLNEITTSDLALLADEICGRKNAFHTRYSYLSGEAIALYHSTDTYKKLSTPVGENIDINGRWFYIEIDQIKRGSIIDINGNVYDVSEGMIISEDSIINIVSNF